MSFTWELMRTKTCSVIPNSMWAILKMPAMNTSNWLAFRNLGRKVMVMEVENLHWMSKVLASRWEGWLPAVVCGNIFEHRWVVGESQDDLGSKLWDLGCEINDRYRNGKKNARSDKTNKQFVYIFQLRFLLRSARVPILGDVLRQLLVVCPVAR